MAFEIQLTVSIVLRTAYRSESGYPLRFDKRQSKILHIIKHIAYPFVITVINNLLMKYILISGMLLISLNLLAQDCTETSILQKPGIWKEGQKGSVSGIPATDLDKERKVVAALHTLIKSKYAPMGVEADFNGSYDRPDTEIPVNNYNYNIYFLHYFCEKNVIKTAHETSTTLTIAANRFDGKIFETPDENNASGEGYYFLLNMPVEKDGCFYFEEAASLGFGMTGKSLNWLITADGKLPYAYVSKKEFLEKQKHMLLTSMPKSIESSKESLKQNEEEKVRKQEEYKNDPEKLQRYMKNSYLYNKDRFEKDGIRMEQNYNNALTKIETLLKTLSGELDQPAIVKQDPNDYLSYLFTTHDDTHGRVLIKPNPGYFNSKLSRSSPQFFLVNITGNEKEAISAKVMTDIIKNFDFTALKNMLEK